MRRGRSGLNVGRDGNTRLMPLSYLRQTRDHSYVETLADVAILELFAGFHHFSFPKQCGHIDRGFNQTEECESASGVLRLQVVVVNNSCCVSVPNNSCSW